MGTPLQLDSIASVFFSTYLPSVFAFFFTAYLLEGPVRVLFPQRFPDSRSGAMRGGIYSLLGLLLWAPIPAAGILIRYSLGIPKAGGCYFGGLTEKVGCDTGPLAIVFAVLWLVTIFLIADALFYWTHRLMHHHWFYTRVHRVHHQFTKPTAWSGYAFHLYEGILLAVCTVLIPYLFVPSNQFLAGVFNVASGTWVAFLHSGFRTPGWTTHPILRHLNSPSAHGDHHLLGESHYSLFFNWWDKAFTAVPEDATSVARG